MKKLLTLSFVACFALSANAVPAQGNTRTLAGGRIIYNVSPLPPIQNGSRVEYPVGNVRVDAGKTTPCHNTLGVVDSRDASRKNVNCDPRTDEQLSMDAANAAALANLAPAAGGSPEQNLMSDTYLRVDNRAEMRSDKKLGY